MGARTTAAWFLIALGAVAISGCGGGGGSASALPAVPSVASTPAISVPAAVSGSATVAFTVAIPAAATTSATRRGPRYVSPGTKSVLIAFNGNAVPVNCTKACSTTFSVAPGKITFSVGLHAGQNGTGALLATGQASTTVVPGQTHTVAITFGGVVAKIALSLGSATVKRGTGAKIPVTVSAQDAAGYTIVGPDAYASPIVLTDGDASGATSLSAAGVTAPGTTVTLSYNGAASFSSASITASVAGSGVAPEKVTLSAAQEPVATPVPTATPTPVAASQAPNHVKNFAYYGLNGMDADIPAAYMAAHVDIVEDDGFTAQHALAFKRAGGKLAFSYTDPTYVPHCPAPFVPPSGACQGPIGNLVANDEKAYVHDASGARVHRFVSTYFQYQEVLNAGSSDAQNAYAKTTASILAASPLLDGFLADDSGSPLTGGNGVFGSELYYGFDATGVEFPTDASWIAGESAMLAAAGKPVIINGGDPTTLGPAYNGAFLDLPSVTGQMFEGCFNNDGGYLYTNTNGQFAHEEDGLLAVEQHHKLALCMPTGDATNTAKRLYAYAAFLLAYDPAYSVYGMNQAQTDGETLYPETQLVPQSPLQTASSISQLARGSVSVREFGACSIAGNAIGPCAAVVNSSPSAGATIPKLTGTYAHAIALDAQSTYHGGTVHVVAGAPTQLAAQSAAILVR